MRVSKSTVARVMIVVKCLLSPIPPKKMSKMKRRMMMLLNDIRIKITLNDGPGKRFVWDILQEPDASLWDTGEANTIQEAVDGVKLGLQAMVDDFIITDPRETGACPREDTDALHQ
jgi:hypothetical protein